MSNVIDDRAHEVQRRAVIGNRHFILADPKRCTSTWAIPGLNVVRELGDVREFGPARIVTTEQLRRSAVASGQVLQIIEKYPLIRKSVDKS